MRFEDLIKKGEVRKAEKDTNLTKSLVISKDADVSPFAPLILQKLKVSDSSQESQRFLKSRERHKKMVKNLCHLLYLFN